MARLFPKQQKNVADLGFAPTAKHDGRQVGAADRTTFASKVTADNWAVGDEIYLGRKSAGHTLRSIAICASASLGTTTISVGTGPDPRASTAALTNATKYVNAATMTTADRLTNLGPRASTLDDDPPGEEHIWATIGVAAIGPGVDLTIILATTGID